MKRRRRKEEREIREWRSLDLESGGQEKKREKEKREKRMIEENR